jgi:hypothetical protein
MDQDIDVLLADKLEFHVNHEKRRIESTNPDVFLRDRGYSPEPYMHYFTLHWNGREIPAKAEENKQAVGKNAYGQWIWEVHWRVLSIGFPDYASKEAAPSFEFKSKEEYICSANLILKALRVYGGVANAPQFNLFPEYRKITAELSASLKAHIYGELN